MRKSTISLIAILSVVGLVSARDCSESHVSKSPLTIYSGGVMVGSVKSLTPELKDIQPQFLKLSFSNTFYIRDRIDLFFDVDWFGLTPNFGTDIGFDFYLTTFRIRPFAGFGVGVHYFDREDDYIGVSGTVHAGVALNLTPGVQVRFRVPFHVIATQSRDEAAGLDVGFLFSKSYKKVKKLDYNQ